MTTRSAIRRRMLGALAAATLAAPAHAQLGRAGPRAATVAGSQEERKILAVLAAVYRDHRYLSVPEADGRLLRLLAESIGAQEVVELGTSTGYSGLWLLLALTRTGGRLTTFEIDKGRNAMAREHFAQAGVGDRVIAVLGDAHAEVAKLKGPVDLVFIDADKEGYLDYFVKLAPLVRPGGLVVAHNMASPPPDPRYFEAVTKSPAYETVFLNMDDAGVGVTMKKR